MACRYFSGDLRDEPDHHTMEQAWNNLQKFRYVLEFECLTQDSNKFLVANSLSELALPHENRHSYPSPGAADRELIERFNVLDVKLHNRWIAHRSCGQQVVDPYA